MPSRTARWRLAIGSTGAAVSDCRSAMPQQERADPLGSAAAIEIEDVAHGHPPLPGHRLMRLCGKDRGPSKRRLQRDSPSSISIFVLVSARADTSAGSWNIVVAGSSRSLADSRSTPHSDLPDRCVRSTIPRRTMRRAGHELALADNQLARTVRPRRRLGEQFVENIRAQPRKDRQRRKFLGAEWEGR